MEPVERVERAPEDDARESDDEEAEDHDEDLAASLEYEDMMSQTPPKAPALAKKPAPAAPPPAVDPALSAQMCVMLKEQGNEHFKAGRYDAALRAHERAAAHDPSNPHLWLNNAAALLKLDRPEEAIWNSNRALVLTSGKNAKAWFRRAAGFQKLGYVSCALSDANEATVLEPTDQAILGLSQQLSTQLRKEQAEAEKDATRDESHWFDVISGYQEGVIANSVFAGEEKLHLSAFAGGKAVVTQPAAFTFKKKEGLAGAISAALYLLRSNNTLQDLDLSGLPLYVIQASVALAEFAKKNHSLRILNASHTRLGPFGAQVLSTSLTFGTLPLTHLCLDDCGLGTQGAQALARYIAKDARLVHLSLAVNSLRDQGAAIIMRALTTNDKLALTSLSLATNYITGKCEDDLAAFAIRHAAVTTDLSDNPLTVQRVESLLKALPVSSGKFKCDELPPDSSTQLLALASPALVSAKARSSLMTSELGPPSAAQPLY